MSQSPVRVRTRLVQGIASLLFTTTFSTSIFAADLLGLYELAKENDRTFSAARNDYEAVNQTLKQARGLYYPSVSVSYEHIETEQTINRSDNEVFGSGASDYPTDEMTLSLNQPLFRWDFLNERRLAKAEVRQAEYQLAAAEQELMLRTAEAYLLSLAAADNAFVTRAEQDAVGQQLALAEKRLDVGLASPTEVHESRARFELNQAEVIEADNDIADRDEGLRNITGQAPGALMPLKEDFGMVTPDPTDPEQWISMGLANNLSVKSLEAALEVADAEYRRQKADRYPTLDLVARFANRDTGGSLFGGGSDVDTNEIAVRADWTVFQGGVLRARIKEALYRKQRAEDDLELERNRVRRGIRNAYLGVVSSIARANALKSSLEAQDLTVQAKQKGFETGTNANIEVLDAKRDFFFLQRDFLKARYDYLLAYLDLKRQVGSLSEGDLAMINGLLETAGVDSLSAYEEALAIQLPESVTGTADMGSDIEPDVVPDRGPDMASNDDALANPVDDDARAIVDELVSAGEPVMGDTVPQPHALRPAIEGAAAEDAEDPVVASYRWLFNQRAETYVSQLGSFRDPGEAARFADRLADSGRPVHQFISRGDKGNWRFVLSDAFESRDEAVREAGLLGVDEPWVRRAGELRHGRCEVIALQPVRLQPALAQICRQGGIAADIETGLDPAQMAMEKDAQIPGA